MSHTLKVAIAGAGVGGLTVAAALRRIGAEPTIFERAADLRHMQVGGSFHLWPNALRALEWAGLVGRRCSRRSTTAPTSPPDLPGAGRASCSSNGRSRATSICPTLSVVRGEVHEVLAARRRRSALGAGRRGWDADADGVTVELADGSDASASTC